MKLIQDMGVGKTPFVVDLLMKRAKPFGYYHHAHQGMEILYVHAGWGQVIVNQQRHPIRPGTLLFFQPFQLHRVQMEDVSPQSPYIRSVVTFEPTLFDSYLIAMPELQLFFRYLWKGALTTQLLYLPEKNDMLDQLLAYYKPRFPVPAESAGEECLEPAMLLTMQLFDYIRMFWGSERIDQPQDARNHHAQSILQWVEEHYAEAFQLERLASDLHLSKYHISHLFKQYTGSTINEYLVARRIRQACWLLQTSPLPVHEVGTLVGYDNPSYFCQLFRKMTALTPQAYRRMREASFRL
ncbi:AraC family transcriptional regulator [Paenibacillus ginsengarvi]|uniref:AraC family transcriptional regulator n=1 Tax=Paenibacillus ginsengarvi TaxID=400777 RepID=UPI0013154A67|nr:AraC family transcriptional regulator [Paenibacillus ginsengarvi]